MTDEEILEFIRLDFVYRRETLQLAIKSEYFTTIEKLVNFSMETHQQFLEYMLTTHDESATKIISEVADAYEIAGLPLVLSAEEVHPLVSHRFRPFKVMMAIYELSAISYWKHSVSRLRTTAY